MEIEEVHSNSIFLLRSSFFCGTLVVSGRINIDHPIGGFAVAKQSAGDDGDEKVAEKMKQNDATKRRERRIAQR